MTIRDILTRLSGPTVVSILADDETVLAGDLVFGNTVENNVKFKPYLDKEVEYIHTCTGGGLLLMLKEE